MKGYLVLAVILAVVAAQASTFNPEHNGDIDGVDPMKFVKMIVEEFDKEMAAAQPTNQLRKSSETQTSTADKASSTFSSTDDDEEFEMFLILVVVFLVIFMVIVLALAIRRPQNRMLPQQNQQAQLLQNRSLPEQINFHYAEAHHLELLLQQQQSIQQAYPATVPYAQPSHYR